MSARSIADYYAHLTKNEIKDAYSPPCMIRWMVSVYRYSTKTDVVLGGTVKHPVDVSYDELFTTSSDDIACIKIPIERKKIKLNRKQHFPT